jgi:hypothetical protein
MSVCLSFKDGVVARKSHRCAFCFEPINPGDIYDKRAGVSEGNGHWTMHMHPECHAYENTALGPDDYEGMSDPSFTREEARQFVAAKQKPPA